MDEREKWIRIRIRLVAICFILAFGFIVVRAFQLQVIGQQRWQKKADRQYQRTIPLLAQRGTIFDRNGEKLAVSVGVDSLFIVPSKIESPDKSAKMLADALSMDRRTVRDKMRSEKNFLWIKRQATPSESDRVRAMQLPGVGFIKEHRRYYPNSEIGAQVIGFTGLDPKGLEGLELAYDSTMLGQGGFLVMERDALGRGMSGADSKVEGGAQGSDLYLTLDKNLQYIVEKELAAGLRETKAKAGTAILINPMTGAVLAMANQPDYNPNAIQQHQPGDWRNRALSDTFEPGSTIKVFLMAAALNEGVITEKSRIDCENGSYRVSDKTIHDHKKYGMMNPAEILKFSSNIGSVKIGKMLERERYYGYLKDFGFGSRSGVDLPGEVNGILHDPSRWFEIDLAAISFGQGLTVTPLQLAMATAAIANGGYLMSPYVVEKVVDPFGQVKIENRPRVRRKVVGRDVADQVRKMMTAVAESGGTGVKASVPGYKVAGKTGTAQKVDPVTGGYSMDRSVASFVGFVPADDPQLVILVVLDEPEGKGYGGINAAPVFSSIAEQALRYLKVMPTEKIDRTTLIAASDNGGFSSVPVVYPGNDSGRLATMPDFRGMSYRQVMRTMEQTGLNLKLQGTGRVVAQSPDAGAPIRFDNATWVRLAPPS
ncbi:MAG: transpeptidase family protein [Desulfuromonadales bacterium]|nr:transpeptidase family protein [Desulfuromonadales bacterium]